MRVCVVSNRQAWCERLRGKETLKHRSASSSLLHTLTVGHFGSFTAVTAPCKLDQTIHTCSCDEGQMSRLNKVSGGIRMRQCELFSLINKNIKNVIFCFT